MAFTAQFQAFHFESISWNAESPVPSTVNEEQKIPLNNSQTFYVPNKEKQFVQCKVKQKCLKSLAWEVHKNTLYLSTAI